MKCRQNRTICYPCISIILSYDLTMAILGLWDVTIKLVVWCVETPIICLQGSCLE